MGDFVIPPGVIVWPMLYALHNSTHNWDAPGEFRPERWLGRGWDEADETGPLAPPPAPPTPGGGGGGLLPLGTDSQTEAGSPPPPSPPAAARKAAAGKRFMPFSDGMKSCLGQVGCRARVVLP